MESREYETAEKHARKALSLLDGAPDALIVLAESLSAQGRVREAQLLLETAAGDGGATIVVAGLARLHCDAGRFREGNRLIRAARGSSPSDESLLSAASFCLELLAERDPGDETAKDLETLAWVGREKSLVVDRAKRAPAQGVEPSCDEVACETLCLLLPEKARLARSKTFARWVGETTPWEIRECSPFQDCGWGRFSAVRESEVAAGLEVCVDYQNWRPDRQKEIRLVVAYALPPDPPGTPRQLRVQ